MLERVDMSSVGVLDSENDEGLSLFVFVFEEISEFFCKSQEMVRPRNNVPECDDSADLVLNVRNANVVEPSDELGVPVEDYVVVCWCVFSGVVGQGKVCNPSEEVLMIRCDKAMFKPHKTTKGNDGVQTARSAGVERTKSIVERTRDRVR